MKTLVKAAFPGPDLHQILCQRPAEAVVCFLSLIYCFVAAQVLILRKQTGSLQFPCEKIKTDQEREKT